MARWFSIILLCTLLLLACNAEGAIPTLAYKLRPYLIQQSHYTWGLQQKPTVFFAQIHQESGWKVDAKSPVGASGLAQFMPSTSEWISKLYPKDLGDKKWPLEAKSAIRGLLRYDKMLYTGINSMEKWPMTLSAYNGGLTWLNRDRALTEANDDNPDLWFGNVEKHSNRAGWAKTENRGYVARILKVLKPIYERAGF